jgi:hypothetical protein
MGKTSAELEREIGEHRRRMTWKRDRLEHRVRSGVRDARDAVNDEVMSRTNINEYAQQRPLTTLAAAFGAGVLLGAVSDGSGGGREEYRGDRNHQRSEQGSGLLAGMLGTVTGPLGNTIQDELRLAIRDFFGRGEAESASQEYSGAAAPAKEPAAQPHLRGL